MATTYQGVSLQKGSLYDIVASYCSFTGPLEPTTQRAVQKLDEAFQNNESWKAFTKKAGVYLKRRDIPRGVLHFYQDLYRNNQRAHSIGMAQAYLAHLDAKEAGVFTDVEILDMAGASYANASSLCEAGDQFYCGASEALRDVIENDGNLFYGGFLGRTIAPYFGVMWWHEDPRLPQETVEAGCKNVNKRVQQFEIPSTARAMNHTDGTAY